MVRIIFEWTSTLICRSLEDLRFDSRGNGKNLRRKA